MWFLWNVSITWLKGGNNWHHVTMYFPCKQTSCCWEESQYAKLLLWHVHFALHPSSVWMTLKVVAIITHKWDKISGRLHVNMHRMEQNQFSEGKLTGQKKYSQYLMWFSHNHNTTMQIVNSQAWKGCRPVTSSTQIKAGPQQRSERKVRQKLQQSYVMLTCLHF